MSQPRWTALAETGAIDRASGDHPPSTMGEAVQRVAAARAAEIALRTAGGGPSYTWAQYADRVALIAGGPAARGVRRGDAVALLLTNRPEFPFAARPGRPAAAADTAAQHLGAVSFSCYATSAPEAEHIRAYDVLPEGWPPGGDLVTSSMKERRRAVPQRYADRVDALHAPR
jgi:long-subunit acyl-CoA synthetase (AMP-forming)